MKNKNTQYIVLGLTIVILLGVLVYSQTSGQLFQGALVRTLNTTTQTLPTTTSTAPANSLTQTATKTTTSTAPVNSLTQTTTTSPTSYTAPDQSIIALSRIEQKLDALTASVQAQNTKLDTLTNSLKTFRSKVNIFAEEIASMVLLGCSNANYSTCSTSYGRIYIESQTN